MSSEDYGKVRILCYYVFFDTVACFRAVCNLRSFFECFTTFITCDHITVFCCFLLCFTYLKSLKVFVLCQFDSLNFHLVFVCCHFCPSWRIQIQKREIQRWIQKRESKRQLYFKILAYTLILNALLRNKMKPYLIVLFLSRLLSFYFQRILIYRK